jgi:hypothetical protein
MSESLEDELGSQIAQQKAALDDVEAALAITAPEEAGELQDMHHQLLGAIADLESALLELKRAQLLQHLDTLQAPPVQDQPAATDTPAFAAPALADGTPCRCCMQPPAWACMRQRLGRM